MEWAVVVNRGRQDTTRPEPARWGIWGGGAQKPQRRPPVVLVAAAARATA
jgi:hypothetical protein